MGMDLERLLHEVSDFEIPKPESNVLVIDDEQLVLDVIERALTAEELPVLTATSGELGLELMEASPVPRVVLVDKNLTGISGIEVLRRGKALLPASEFIVITGYASIESAIEAMELGAFGYLTKPFSSLDVISKRVFAALEKNRAVHQNRLLVKRLREAYKELYQTKVELDMMNQILNEKLAEQGREVKQGVEQLEAPLRTLAEHTASLEEFLSDAAAAGGPLARGAKEHHQRVKKTIEMMQLAQEARHGMARALTGDADAD